MTNDMLPPLGVTFYVMTSEDLKAVGKIRNRLEAAEIPNMWVKTEWNGKMVDALNVYANANVVAQYLRD
jgi:hypothetical protein